MNDTPRGGWMDGCTCATGKGLCGGHCELISGEERFAAALLCVRSREEQLAQFLKARFSA